MTRLLFLLVFCCSVLKAGDSDRLADVTRFVPVDLFVDSKTESLAAYQLNFSALRGQIKIVGIEGGEANVFRDPPYYDPRAMQKERVILAAFSTARVGQLPRGRTRIATVHLVVHGSETPVFSANIEAAATVDGKSISADAIALERKRE